MNTSSPKLDLIASGLNVKLNKYIPHKPTVKQIAFLLLTKFEGLYGGALGGGKSDGLLTAALQHVDTPGYSALILRKTLTDLQQSGALLDRMTSWMRPFLATKEVKYEPGKNHRFLFPTFNPDGTPGEPAKIAFGYLGQLNAETRYQGIEIQFLGVDEITQHKEHDYTYLLTRIRKNVCPKHLERDENKDPIFHDDCPWCQQQKNLPLRARATCNPDGVGFMWVKNRWAIGPDKTPEEAEETGEKIRWIGKDPERPFIPASYKDNPYLNHKQYEEDMKSRLSKELYEALMEGSWGVIANARFKTKWKRVFSKQGRHITLGPGFRGNLVDAETGCQRIFQTVDTATTLLEGPGDVDLFKSKVATPSNTCICTWMLTACYNLLWLDVLIFREEIPEVVSQLRTMYNRWSPSYVVIEENGVGKGVAQYARRLGMVVKGIHKDKDKLVAATSAIMQMSKGRIWVPESTGGTQFEQALDEVFSWQGHPNEPDDVVDNLSLACNDVDWSLAPDPHDYFRANTVSLQDMPKAVFSRHRHQV